MMSKPMDHNQHISTGSVGPSSHENPVSTYPMPSQYGHVQPGNASLCYYLLLKGWLIGSYGHN